MSKRNRLSIRYSWETATISLSDRFIDSYHPPHNISLNLISWNSLIWIRLRRWLKIDQGNINSNRIQNLNLLVFFSMSFALCPIYMSNLYVHYADRQHDILSVPVTTRKQHLKDSIHLIDILSSIHSTSSSLPSISFRITSFLRYFLFDYPFIFLTSFTCFLPFTPFR